MTYNRDGSTTLDWYDSWFHLYRDVHEVTKPEDTVENYELGKLKAVMVIRIPTIFFTMKYRLQILLGITDVYGRKII